jgi:hypothetical protein
LDGDENLLFYDDVRNVMIDCGGFIVWNIFDYISPNDLYLFKTHKEDMVVVNNSGQRIELIWPEHEGDEYLDIERRFGDEF